jgi:predicted Zn-dependent protease
MFIGVIGALMILPSIFAHSREMEHDADMGGVSFMANAGYDTRQAAGIWEQLRAEMDATAAERKTKSRKDKNGGMFATHPPSAERVTYLTEAAKQRPGTPGAAGDEAYAAVMRAYWPEIIDDQLKRNDFGAADYLLNALEKEQAADWLSYAHGELYRRRAGAGDLEKAVVYYGQGIAEGGTVPELWRGRGLALLKLGKPAEGKTDLGEYLKRAPEASDKSMIAMMAGE